MTFVPLSDLPDDCSGSHGEVPEVDKGHTHVDDWFNREGVRQEDLGIVLVHPDGDQPIYGPHLGDVHERAEREAWVRSFRMRAVHGVGLGKNAHDPALHPAARYFERLPKELLHQQSVMQCLRGPGFTTRFDHQVDSMYVGGLIATRAGLSRSQIELAAFTLIAHDWGHRAFAHSSERAIGQFLRRHGLVNGPVEYDHAEESGRVVAGLVGADPELRDWVHGVGNHSWHLRHGVDVSISAGLAADLAGAADRVSYSITDVLDAIRGDRISWGEVPHLFPKAFALADMGPVEVRRMLKMGQERGLLHFQERMRNTFVNQFAKVIREQSVVGLSFQASDALKEIRQTAASRLFMIDEHRVWESELVELCDVALELLRHDVEAEGIEDNAPQEAVRRFSSMTESEVINMVARRSMDVGFDLAKLNSHPPVSVPRVRASRAKFSALAPQQPLIPLKELMGDVFHLTCDNGQRANLSAEETMNLLGSLNARGHQPVSVRIRSAQGDPATSATRFTVPSGALEKQQLFQSLEIALESALERTLARLKSNCHTSTAPSPKHVREVPSLLKLSALAEEHHGRPAAIMRGYSDAYHSAQVTLAPRVAMVPVAPSLALTMS